MPDEHAVAILKNFDIRTNCPHFSDEYIGRFCDIFYAREFVLTERFLSLKIPYAKKYYEQPDAGFDPERTSIL